MRKYLPWVVCALTAAVGVPALAWGAGAEVDATVTAHDDYFRDASSSDPEDNVVNILPGQTVTFRYNEGGGGNSHNVRFSVQPTTCTQVAPAPLPIPSCPCHRCRSS